MEDILALVLIFGGGTLVAISFSPIGRAIAERIRGGRAHEGVDPELQADMADLREQMEALRQELVETHERVDFTERLLAQRSADQLPQG